MEHKSFSRHDPDPMQKSNLLMKMVPVIAAIIADHPTLNFEENIAIWIDSKVYRDYRVCKSF